jgi:hypothetical protein
LGEVIGSWNGRVKNDSTLFLLYFKFHEAAIYLKNVLFKKFCYIQTIPAKIWLTSGGAL